MGATNSPKAFVGQMRNVSKALDAERTRQLGNLGETMDAAFNRALSGDLNKTGTPLGLSHWAKGADIVAKTQRQGTDTIRFAPVGASKGRLRVAEDGRAAYAAGDRRLTGRVSKKTGTALSRRVKKTTGAMKGFGSWTHAVKAIETVLPPKIGKDFANAMRKVFM